MAVETCEIVRKCLELLKAEGNIIAAPDYPPLSLTWEGSDFKVTHTYADPKGKYGTSRTKNSLFIWHNRRRVLTKTYKRLEELDKLRPSKAEWREKIISVIEKELQKARKNTCKLSTHSFLGMISLIDKHV